MKHNNCLLRLLAAVAVMWAACSLSGCGNSARATNKPTTVYVCCKTHDVFVGPVPKDVQRLPDAAGETP